MQFEDLTTKLYDKRRVSKCVWGCAARKVEGVGFRWVLRAKGVGVSASLQHEVPGVRVLAEFEFTVQNPRSPESPIPLS